MQTLLGLRRQIESATDLGSVVTTMKTLAAVSIHQYEEAVEALKDYNRTIELGFQVALRGKSPRLYREPTNENVGVIVFGTNQGMCGQFNEEIVTLMNEWSRQRPSGSKCLLLAVGIRAQGHLHEIGWQTWRDYETPSSVNGITDLVQSMLPQLEEFQERQGVSQLLAFYNRRTSASLYQPTRLQLLPIDVKRLREWQQREWDSNSLPCFVTDRRQLLSRLVRQYLFVSLFTACAESLASENASRIVAMQAAEKNIQERLDELRSTFNHLRQSAITEEILDVVTGFEALSGESG